MHSVSGGGMGRHVLAVALQECEMLHGCVKVLGGSSKMRLWQGKFSVTQSVQKPGGVLGIAQGAEGN